jgi:hypothetical protein
LRKLTPIEEAAYAVIQAEQSVIIAGDELRADVQVLMQRTFDSLVKKKRAVAEQTDGGVRYHAL